MSQELVAGAASKRPRSETPETAEALSDKKEKLEADE
jgi:hypothetical protein